MNCSYRRLDSRILFAFVLLTAAGLVLPRQTCGGGSSTRITQTLKGPSDNATDLHVSVDNGKIESGSAPPFKSSTISEDKKQITFNLADVPSGQSVKLDLMVKGSDSANTTMWSWSKPVEGIFETISAQASLNVLHNPDGTVTLGLDNLTSQALTYANLQIATGALGSYYNGDFESGLFTGLPVALEVPTSGSFQPGLTDLAIFTPSALPDTYTGGFGQLDGSDFGRASDSGVVPEPSTLTLLLTGVPFFVYIVRRHQRRRQESP
jgi:hypothetical protein